MPKCGQVWATESHYNLLSKGTFQTFRQSNFTAQDIGQCGAVRVLSPQHPEMLWGTADVQQPGLVSALSKIWALSNHIVVPNSAVNMQSGVSASFVSAVKGQTIPGPPAMRPLIWHKKTATTMLTRHTVYRAFALPVRAPARSLPPVWWLQAVLQAWQPRSYLRSYQTTVLRTPEITVRTKLTYLPIIIRQLPR